MPFSKEQIRLLFFIFCEDLISGMVFLGITSSFILMLSDSGYYMSQISLISITTSAYSFKFLLAPYIQNLISKTNIKILSSILVLCVTILFSELGIFNTYNNTLLAMIIIFLLIIGISACNILRTFIKLNNFNSNHFAFVNAITNTGFRCGMLLGSGIILHLEYFVGWERAFGCVILFFTLLTLISIFLLPNISNKLQVSSSLNLKQAYISARKFFTLYGFTAIFFLMSSFKISDSSINMTKSLFLKDIGLSKILIANISNIPSIFALILGGFIGAFINSKCRSKDAIKLALSLQVVICYLFFFLTIHHNNLFIIGLILTFSSSCFGFSNIIYHSYIDRLSQKDVTLNTVLGSLGSLFRTICASLAIFSIAYISWAQLYIICSVLAIFGIMLFFKTNKHNT